MENTKTRDEIACNDDIALERFKIISPILSAIEEKADKGKISLLKGEACREAGISRKTLARWLDRYAQNGFDGLKYQGGTAEPKRIIPGELVKEAILLRMEVPTRSVPQIIEILEMEGKAPVGLLKRSTLQDRLREEGYSRAQMKLYQKPGVAARRFARSERNDMWQADIKFGPYIKTDGKNKRIYFVGFAAPYSPESKGKIERFNGSLNSFLAEASLKQTRTLGDFNDLFNVWLAECYHNREHSGIDTTPELAYKSSKIPLRFLSAETVAKAFLRLEQRKVDKSGCISFGGRKYEVGVIYIGRTVDIVYDSADTSVLTVEDKHFNTSFRIKELVIGEHTGPRPKLPEFMTPQEPETSRLLDEKRKRYDKRQLSAKRAISYAQINKGGEDNV